MQHFQQMCKLSIELDNLFTTIIYYIYIYYIYIYICSGIFFSYNKIKVVNTNILN